MSPFTSSGGQVFWGIAPLTPDMASGIMAVFEKHGHATGDWQLYDELSAAQSDAEMREPA